MKNDIVHKSRLPATVVTLGIVSFLTDISSEMIYPLVPIFMNEILRAPYTAIGFTEAFAEATTALLKVISGVISDRTRRRKPLAVLGYSLSSFSKPLLAISQSWTHVFTIRFADRVGKGIRSAPRDALIADVVDEKNYGKAFGLHRAMDTAGAVLGPLVAFLIIGKFDGSSIGASGYRTIFILAAVPAILAVIILSAFIREKEKIPAESKSSILNFSKLDRRYKLFLIVVGIFALGNSSDVFLILRARNLGVGVGDVLLLYVIFNVAAASLAVPAGKLSDRIGRKPLIVAGYLIFALVYSAFALIESKLWMWPLFIVYGTYYGCTEGVLRAFAADLAPAQSRATAIGSYHTVVGLGVLPAGIIAGLLWDNFGPAWPFIYGASTAVLSCFAMIVLLRGKRQMSNA